MNLVLGAGLSGLSVSYHLGHENCLLLEKNLHPYGHLRSDFRDGFTWDQGPHVSFTKHDYVKKLFERSVGEDGFEEYEVRTANYFQGTWIDHPAQSSLYQIPEPLRSECLQSFLSSRNTAASAAPPANYAEWLERAFGPRFAATFPFAYTRKYWTRDAHDLGVDWVGGRVYLPEVDDVVKGSRGPLDKNTHYITKVRYPKKGGYQAFARGMAQGAAIRYGAEVQKIDLALKKIWTADGASYSYTRLINTLPLPVFVALCVQATPGIVEAARSLSCSQALFVNVTAPHSTLRPENWMYVYDEDKYSTRINCTELLSAGNAPAHHTGVQVEVYFSRHRPLPESPEQIAIKVKGELAEMGNISNAAFERGLVAHSLAYAPWANVIFDHSTSSTLNCVWEWLEQFGLGREEGDTNPITNWSDALESVPGQIVCAGRFAQWKYFWTDDCVLRGRNLANRADLARSRGLPKECS